MHPDEIAPRQILGDAFPRSEIAEAEVVHRPR
jgi:hypothetical protein